jgi:hypothetical protein
MYTGSPSRFEPQNWLKDDDKDFVTWHHNRGDFPEFDSDDRHGSGEWGGFDIHEDDEGRLRHKDLGYMSGMHFGTPKAGYDRYGGSEAVGHPVRIARSTLETPLSINVQADKDPETGMRRWTDKEANFSPSLQDKVEDGKTIPYENTFEDIGSTSYKALRYTARTWADDVEAAHERNRGGVSAAQLDAVKKGYDLALPSGKRAASIYENRQPQLPFESGQVLDRYGRSHSNQSAEAVGEMLRNPAPYTTLRKKTET